MLLLYVHQLYFWNYETALVRCHGIVVLQCSAVHKHVCWGQCPHVQLLAVSNSMNILRNLHVGFAHFRVHVHIISLYSDK